MTMRTTKSMVTFKAPFSMPSISGEQPERMRKIVKVKADAKD